MFKKFLFMAIALLTLLSFVCCSLPETPDGSQGGDPPSTDGTGDGGEEDDGSGEGEGEGGAEDGGEGSEPDAPIYSPYDDMSVIFSPEVSVSLIKSADVGSFPELSEIADRIFEITNKFAVINTDKSFKDKRELVFGDTTRDVSAEAKLRLESTFELEITKLENQGIDTTYYTGFAILCSEGSVALVWMDNESKTLAFEHFTENFLASPTLYMDEGFFDVKIFSTWEMLLKKDEADKQAAYDKITAEYGAETLAAIKTHLSMFDDRFYYWLADLYDPGEYDEDGNPLGGGFYYSNSARDTIGFNIDVESTRQALSFLSSAGMLKGTSLKEAIPEKMQKEIVAFVLSLQSSEDGYFYHPQWGTNIGTSRRSRDLSWSTSLLSSFGYQPYYDTPNGVKGTRGAPGASAASALTSPVFGKSTVSAVSKIVPTASAWTGSEQLSTIGKWEEYILSFESTIETKSYSIGNTFGSQTGQVVTRDKLAIENGEFKDDNADGIADGGFIETFEKYFNLWQKDNGLWEDCSVEDGTVYYNAINGLMKISGAYNGLGLKFPKAAEAFECAAFMATYLGDGVNWADSKGKSPTGSVDVYNPWVAMSTLISNMKKFGSTEEAEALRSQLKERAYELITVTTTKCAKFAKEDGSYGYTWSSSPSTSQGAPASVPNTVEGDINGGGIAFTGTWGNMTSVLGINLKPFGRVELKNFLDRLADNGHIDKTVKLYDFEELEVGEPLPEYVTGTSERLETVEDTVRGGKAIKMTDIEKTGTTLNLPANHAPGGNCAILEFDIRFDNVTVGQSTAFQIKLGKAFMLVLGVDTKGKLTVGDASSTNGSISNSSFYSGSYNAYSWNNIRVEYYLIDAAARSAKTKVYVNDTLVKTSTNYIGNLKTDPTLPVCDYESVSFYALNSPAFTAFFDNVTAVKMYKKYS